MEPEVRTSEAIGELRQARGGVWRLIRWIHRRRPLLTAVLVLAAPLHAFLSGTPPVDLLAPALEWRFVVPWLLMLLGVAVRLWGSGNLRKNQEITDSGIYRMVRHPLYLGSLALFLAYFLTVGDPFFGLLLFAILIAFVYYPTMLGEEEYLSFRFPSQFSAYRPPPRLLPDVRRWAEVRDSDRFSAPEAYRNLGFRSAWFLLALPLSLRLLEAIIRS